MKKPGELIRVWRGYLVKRFVIKRGTSRSMVSLMRARSFLGSIFFQLALSGTLSSSAEMVRRYWSGAGGFQHTKYLLLKVDHNKYGS